jgi:hypothetical protein
MRGRRRSWVQHQGPAARAGRAGEGVGRHAAGTAFLALGSACPRQRSPRQPQRRTCGAAAAVGNVDAVVSSAAGEAPGCTAPAVTFGATAAGAPTARGSERALADEAATADGEASVEPGDPRRGEAAARYSLSTMRKTDRAPILTGGRPRREPPSTGPLVEVGGQALRVRK